MSAFGMSAPSKALRRASLPLPTRDTARAVWARLRGAQGAA